MGAHESNQSGRKSVRCRVTGPADAELIVGRVRLAARLEDQSASGFAVSVDHCPELEPGATGELHTSAGWFSVRVVRVARLVDGVDGEPSVCRLGLQRLADLDTPADRENNAVGWRSRLFPRRFLPSGASMTIAAAALVVAAAAGPIALAAWHWREDHPAIRWALGWLHSASKERADAALPRTPAVAPNLASLDWDASGASPSPRCEPLQRVAALPGASALAVPEVVAHLELNDAQQKEIARIVDLTADAFRQLETKLRGADRQREAELRQKILDAAQHEALAVLTPQQRQRWETLNPTSAPKPRPEK